MLHILPGSVMIHGDFSAGGDFPSPTGTKIRDHVLDSGNWPVNSPELGLERSGGASRAQCRQSRASRPVAARGWLLGAAEAPGLRGGLRIVTAASRPRTAATAAAYSTAAWNPLVSA